VEIYQVRIQGFRSLRDVTWHPGRLNVVIGPNGTGKSNLIRALELLSLSSRGRVLFDRLVSMGGLRSLLWDRQGRQVQWDLSLGDYNPILGDTEYQYSLTLSARGRDSIENERLSMAFPAAEALSLIARTRDREVHFLDASEHELVLDPSQIDVQSTFLSQAFGHSMAWRTTAFKACLEHWRVYHDLRVDQAASVRQAAVTRVEKQLSPDGQNLIPVLHTLYTGDREFKRTIDAAMSAAFGKDYDELVFPPAEDQRVQMRVRWRTLKSEQSAADLSDGTLRFLMLITILAAARSSPLDLIAIDEPETGLHPSMLPIIAEHAAEVSEDVPILFTTHSPQFLNAFRDEVPTTTVAQWMDGETTLNTVDGDELKRWLERYSLGELFHSGDLEAMI